MQGMSFPKQVTYWLSVVALGLLVGFGIRETRAWMNPIATPPGGVVSAPITASILDQVKTGGLGLVGNLVVGKSVKIGQTGVLCSPDIQGTIQYDVSKKCLLLCDGDSWKCTGSVAAATLPGPGDNALDILKNVCGPGSFNVKTVWSGASDNVTIQCPPNFDPSSSFQVIVDRMTPCEMTRFPYSFSTSNSDILTEALRSYSVGYGCPEGIVKYPEFRCVGDKSGVPGYCEYREGTGTGDIYYSRNGTWSKTLE